MKKLLWFISILAISQAGFAAELSFDFVKLIERAVPEYDYETAAESAKSLLENFDSTRAMRVQDILINLENALKNKSELKIELCQVESDLIFNNHHHSDSIADMAILTAKRNTPVLMATVCFYYFLIKDGRKHDPTEMADLMLRAGGMIAISVASVWNCMNLTCDDEELKNLKFSQPSVHQGIKDVIAVLNENPCLMNYFRYLKNDSLELDNPECVIL